MAFTPKFKQKCKICHKEWVVLRGREFPICVKCHMRQMTFDKITVAKYKFLNIPKELYEKSKFLRSVRQSYLTYKDLTDKQIKAFKKAVRELKKEKSL